MRNGKQRRLSIWQSACAGFRILLIERRLPGKCYQFLYNLLNRMGFKTATISVGRGIKLRGFTTTLSMAQEVWSKKVYDHRDFSYHPSSTVIDVGANLGFFSLYAASKGARVYAFEPCIENYRLLLYNLQANSCGATVKPFNVTVAGKKGRRDLFIGLSSKGEILSGSASIYDTNRGGVDYKTQSIEATTLDAILEENNIERCDFLKIDCEGSEYEILEHASRGALARVQRISMETHNGRGAEALRVLQANGFEILEWTEDYTGFIKARRTL